MKKIREVLRMAGLGTSRRQIARALGISRPSISEYLEAFKKTGLGHAQVEQMSDEELLAMLGRPAVTPERYRGLEERFEAYVRELRRTGVTLQLLWEEYINQEPNGYRYSQFCLHFKEWSKQSELSMHIEHRAGDKMYVDFAGKKLGLVDRKTGELTEVEMFVAILGASQLTYVEAVPSQKKEDWIRANENAFRYIGGVTRAIVPDNLKSGVTKSCKYEPDINPEYADFAAHYGTVILPARPNKPKDKSLVENAVNLTYQRVYAPLRNCVFYALPELNRAIRDQLEKHNNTPMQRPGVSRRQLFEETERAALLPLPVRRYELKRFQKPAAIHKNYHVYLTEDGHYYSVPHEYRLKNGGKAGIIYTSGDVEIYQDNVRIAFHKRDYRRNGYTTAPEHMPSHHRHYAEWNPERFLQAAERRGLHVRRLVKMILEASRHPEQAFKTCDGVIHLSRKFGDSRLNRACERALKFGALSYRAVKNILESGLDQVDEEEPGLSVMPNHENIRGGEYYDEGAKHEQ